MEVSNGHHQQDHQHEKKQSYQQNQVVSCPRCHSTNTKFYYYNNYSLSQPRYFCKGCKRYWTKGGTIRNIPIGGSSCKKNKKSSLLPLGNHFHKNPEKNSLSKTIQKTPQLPLPPLSSDPSDLTLTFDPFLIKNQNTNPNPSFIDILRGPSHGTSRQFQSLSCGFGNGGGNDYGVMQSFYGGGDSTTATTTTGMVEENDDIGGNDVSLGLDIRRDYNDRNGVGSSPSHGMINSSF